MGVCGNCTAWQNGADQMYQADPDVAGIGIISVYIGSALLTLCLSAAHTVLTISDSPAANVFDRLIYRSANRIGFFTIANRKREFWVPVIEKVVLSLSDQQLLTGLAVLIAGFWTHCSISVYHFALVNDLAWFSATVHLTTLDILQDYFLARPMLRNWRVALMAAMALLLVASAVMEGHHEWDDSWPYDAQCLFDELVGNIGGTPGYWMLVNLALICINYPLSIMRLFERPTTFATRWLKTKPREAQDRAIDHLKEKLSSNGRMIRFGCKTSIIIVRTIGWMYFVLMVLVGSQITTLAQDIIWFAYGLWSIVVDRAISPSDMNGNENAMSFGQIMPILLWSSTALVFMEAYDDQMKELEKDGDSRSDSCQLSLVRTRDSTMATPITSRSYEMKGAIQDTEEDDGEVKVSSLRRVDTEMGGRSPTSGHEDRPSRSELYKRPTFPPPSSA